MPIEQHILEAHKLGRLFVETGTDKGNCVQRALDAGFQRVVSVELNPELARNANRRFANNLNVAILEGSSPVVLRQVLPAILEPCTFWLDAHPDHDSPVLQELSLFRRHPIKTHTILIDDRRLMQGHWKTVKEGQVIDFLKAINPDYRISNIPGYNPTDIICAEA